ncbi:hypothetical protein NN561_014699 [Cricetulus griseus]
MGSVTDPALLPCLKQTAKPKDIISLNHSSPQQRATVTNWNEMPQPRLLRIPISSKGRARWVLPTLPCPDQPVRLLPRATPASRRTGPSRPQPPTCQEGGSQRHGDPGAIEQQQDAAGNPRRASARTLSQSPDAAGEPEHRHLEGIPGDCRSRVAASARRPPLQSKGLWAGVPGDSRRREAGARSGGGGVGAPREEGSCGQPRPMRRLFSKGVARSGLAVSPSAPEQGREEGWQSGRSWGSAVALRSALAALEPGWVLAPARAAPAGSPGSRSCRQSFLGAGDKGAPGAVWNLRARTRDHYPGAGATVAPANTVPGGLTLPAAQPRPPAPGSCRSREGASPAPGAPPPPAQRSRPQPGCHTARSRPEQKTRRLPLSQLRKESRARVQRVPSTFHTPLSPSGKGRGLRKLKGRRGEWPWRSDSVLMPLRA